MPLAGEKLPKMCHNKRRYWLESEALRVCQKMAASGFKARPYKCPNCPMWHVTTKV